MTHSVPPRCLGALHSFSSWAFRTSFTPALFVVLATVTVIFSTSAVQADNTDEWLARVRGEERGRVEVAARAGRAVICFFDEKRGGGGAGVVISPEGYGLTNFHVVAQSLETRRGLAGMADGKLYPLEVLGVDPTGDVAMFRLSGKDKFDAAALGDSDQVCVGDRVFAMGNPFGLAEDYAPTATFGMVSGVHRYQYGANERQLVYTDCIQIDASINPGNSGGPLFDTEGRVIGINGRASFERRGRVNVGLAYAISINQIKRFMAGMRAGLLVEHGTLGATTIDLGYRHVVFEEVLEASAASQAGIKVGDRLVEFAGRRMHSANDFASILGVFPAGWAVEVAFERDGQPYRQTIHLDRLPAEVKPSFPFQRDESVTRAEAERVLAEERARAARPGVEPVGPLGAVIEPAIRHTVKLYGASIGDEPGYGTGVMVSDDGHVVTALSLLIEAANLRAVAHDGHVYQTQVIYRDEYRQLAMLKMGRFPENVDTGASVRDQMTPAVFEPYAMDGSRELASGDWVAVVGNPFKVAEGAERMSVTHGVVAGRTVLDAERETQAFPYRGEVILLDAITSNAGSPGSAVVDLEGRWVGLVGKVVTSRQTNTYVNYAYPMEQIKQFVDEALSGAAAAGRPAAVSRPAAAEAKPGYHGIHFSKLGYRRTLPFVRSVESGSPAQTAGIKPNDLIVSVDGVAIPQVRAFEEHCERLRAGDTLSLIIKRGEELIPIRLTLTEVPQ